MHSKARSDPGRSGHAAPHPLAWAEMLRRCCEQLVQSVRALDGLPAAALDGPDEDPCDRHLREARSLRGEIQRHSALLRASRGEAGSVPHAGVRAELGRAGRLLDEAGAAYAGLSDRVDAEMRATLRELTLLRRGRKTMDCYRQTARAETARAR